MIAQRHTTPTAQLQRGTTTGTTPPTVEEESPRTRGPRRVTILKFTQTHTLRQDDPTHPHQPTPGFVFNTLLLHYHPVTTHTTHVRGQAVCGTGVVPRRRRIERGGGQDE